MALTIKAVQTSETSVNSYQSTRRYNPEDSHLHAANEFATVPVNICNMFCNGTNVVSAAQMAALLSRILVPQVLLLKIKERELPAPTQQNTNPWVPQMDIRLSILPINYTQSTLS
jgi:hypothetical protein